MHSALMENPVSRGIRLVLLILAVAACDGSNYQTTAPATPPQLAPVNPELPPAATLDCDAIAADVGPGDTTLDALPGGIWNGTLTNVSSNRNWHLEGLVAEDGRASLLPYPSGPILSANLAIHGNRFTGTGLAYTDSNNPWADGSLVTTVDTSGTIAERFSIKGIWSTASNETGCFELDRYDGWLYEEASAIASLARVWVGDPTLTVDQDGRFFGQGTCTWTGQISLIDSRYNMYEVATDLSDCMDAGNYVGLAYLGYVFVPERLLVLAINNVHKAIRLVLDD